MTTIRTKRLILRPWQEEDLEPYARLNADPRVMEYFPSTLSREKSDGQARLIMKEIQEKGWGFWAVEVPHVVPFIGWIGLRTVDFSAHFTPAVQIGWRIAFEHWDHGYATEGAQACLQYGFETLNLKEIVSFTALANKRSQRVMQKIGMQHSSAEDFDHPKLPVDCKMRRHVLYRLKNQEWRQNVHQTNKYVYKPYNKIFPDLFQQEKKRLSASLKNVLALEHVGSTAIPNLGGKGIIDIAIAVAKEDLESTCAALQKLGYEFRPSFSTPDRLYFVIYLADPEEGSRRYHIHLTYPSSKDWNELIEFRNYLRTHPEMAEEYAQIKKQAATVANQDGEQYRKLKEPLFQKIHAFIKESHDK